MEKEKSKNLIMKHILTLLIKLIYCCGPAFVNRLDEMNAKKKKQKRYFVLTQICIYFFVLYTWKGTIVPAVPKNGCVFNNFCSVIRSAIKTRAKLMGRWTHLDL